MTFPSFSVICSDPARQVCWTVLATGIGLPLTDPTLTLARQSAGLYDLAQPFTPFAFVLG